jgi:hypothetical protein
MCRHIIMWFKTSSPSVHRLESLRRHTIWNVLKCSNDFSYFPKNRVCKIHFLPKISEKSANRQKKKETLVTLIRSCLFSLSLEHFEYLTIVLTDHIHVSNLIVWRVLIMLCWPKTHFRTLSWNLVQFISFSKLTYQSFCRFTAKFQHILGYISTLSPPNMIT